jgi:hypothetical protein
MPIEKNSNHYHYNRQKQAHPSLPVLVLQALKRSAQSLMAVIA